MRPWNTRLGRAATLLASLLTTQGAAALTLTPVSTGLSGGPGLFAVCKTETFAVCNAPGYFQTDCGKRSLATNANNPGWVCASAAASALAGAKAAQLASYKDVLVPRVLSTPTGTHLGQGLTSRPAWVVSDQPSRHVQLGDKGAFAGKLASLTPAQRSAWNLVQTSPPPGYVGTLGSTPADVSSCTEYAYEKFWDFSRLEDAAAASGHDARVVTNLAFTGTSGWLTPAVPGTTLTCSLGSCGPKAGWYGSSVGGYKLWGAPLRERSGAAMPAFTVPGSGCRTKNAFHEDVPGRLVLGANTCHYTESLAWHGQMAQALAGVSDEKLEYLQSRQQRYRYLANRRGELLMGMTTAQALKCTGKPAGSPGCAVVPLMPEQLNALDAEIDSLRAEAEAAGCTNTGSAPTACDWAPSMFRDRLYSQYRPAREAAYKRCEAALTRLASFDPNGLFPPSSPARLKYYRRSPADFDTVYTEIDKLNSLKAAGVPADSSGAPIVSERLTGGDSLGGDFFGVSYDYDMGYSFTAPKGSNGLPVVCQAEPKAWGDLVVDAKAFSFDVDVLDAHVKASADSFTGDLKVLGKSVFAVNNPSFSQSFNLVNEKHQTGDEWKVTVPVFQFLFITIEVGAGVGYQVGVDVVANLTSSGRLNGLCDTKVQAVLDGQVRSWGRADGFATVAIDALILEAGVKGSLNLIDVNLDFKGRLATELSTASSGPLKGQLVLSVAPRLDYRISTLSGRISLYGCLDLFFFEECVETDLAKWDGVGTSGTLFNRRWTAQADLFQLVLGQ